MEASLTCAVCLGVFREPVTLPRCSHNFCKSCVLECGTPHTWTVVQPRSAQWSSVTCPLCRKVSTLTCGLASLPVNTTLAEVVRLLPSNGKTGESQSAGASSGSPGKDSCAEHPEHKLELFCKNCAHACCGKCVSLHHQGIFHNVNLLDMIFQEEKLVFFNSLKTLREVHEKLLKEITDEEKNTESILKANEDAVASAFGEVQKALDLKKEQLLDLVKQQQSSCIKRNEVRKITKVHQKTTVESLLKACEAIVEDNEPKSFLQVACGLNKRMKSNLELMEFCADRNETVLSIEPQCVDVQAVLDAVSALNITSGSKDLSKQNGSFSFKSISRTWTHGMTSNMKYCPVQDQELFYLQGQMQKMSIRYVCITKMPEYQHLSYEELRVKYYEPSTVQEKESISTTEGQRPFICSNVNNFSFKMSLTNGARSTRLKRQDAVDRERKVHGKDVFKEKSPKAELGKMEQNDNLFACALKIDSPFKANDFPSSSFGGLTTKLPADIKVEKTPILCSDPSNKALVPNFCLEKSDIAAVKKSGRNEKSCKKLKSTICLPTVLGAGSVASTSAMTNKSDNIFTSGVDNAEENMSVNSASSEEFYDASCNTDPDVEEPCEQSSSRNSTASDESLSLRRSQH